MGQPHREIDILLTHYHIDHVIGFPFFLPNYTPGYSVRVSSPALSTEDAKNKLAQFLNGLYHPVKLRDMMERVSFSPIQPGMTYQRGVFEVSTCRLNHPGGSVAYRVSAGGHSIAYVTDTAPFAKPGEGVTSGRKSPVLEQQVIQFLSGADVVIYDTMYTKTEYLQKMTWGHSYPEYAKAVCQSAGVKHLILFHHSPDATDDELDSISTFWSSNQSPRVSLAKEGSTVHVEG